MTGLSRGYVEDAGSIGCFFFFQAEDGIRDVAVTGVQTCALPISRRGSRSWPPPSPRRRGGAAPSTDRRPRSPRRAPPPAAWARRSSFRPPPPPSPRSEERRVGKECRSRWSPYH